MLKSSTMHPRSSKKFIVVLAFIIAGLGISTAVLASNGPKTPQLVPKAVATPATSPPASGKAAAAPAAPAAPANAAAPAPAVPAVPPPAASPVHKYAVVIGIDYDHTDFGVVRFADHDAAAVYQMLTEQMGFPRNNIIYLIDDQATGANIIHALDWLATNPGIDANSEVVFYYSGHGLRNGPGIGLNAPGLSPGYALVPFDFYNFDYMKGAGLIWDWDVANRLGQVHPARMWVGIDSCFSGGFIRPGIAGPNRVVTTSSQFDQLSNELPDAQHGVFTKFLLEDGLTNGMSVEQAYLSAFPQSVAYSQEPQIYDGYPGGLQLGG